MFDCLHDMGDPAGAAAYVRTSLKPDGTWLIVEPFANDRLEDNLNSVGRIFYSASTFICTPASRSQKVGACLGSQAREQRLREVVTQGGFKRFRRAAETSSIWCWRPGLKAFTTLAVGHRQLRHPMASRTKTVDLQCRNSR